MSHIVLNRIYYPVKTLGYGKRLGIWVQGCNRNCEKCISPEMQPYDGDAVDVQEIIKKIPRDIEPDGLTISGGEPFDQPEAVMELVNWYRANFNTDVLIYTGYRIEELHRRKDFATKWLLNHIAALVDGPYIDALNEGKGSMGSGNQKLYVWSDQSHYENFVNEERTLQCVQEKDRLFFIGIPPYKEEQ